jgi:hypothetical protein
MICETTDISQPKRKRPSVKDGPLKAYSVTETTEGTGGIVFANCNAAARREGASIHGDGDWDSVECSRRPEFDAFAPGPVPDIEMWRRGWWFHCSCGQRIDDNFGYALDPEFGDVDYDRKAPNARDEPITYRGSLFCNHWCVQRSAERAARERRDARMCAYIAQLALPAGCEVIEGYPNSRYEPVKQEGVPSWRWPSRHFKVWSAKFKFPGAKYHATFEREEGTGFDRPLRNGEVYISNGDTATWYRFRGFTPSAEEIDKHRPYLDSFLAPAPELIAA